MKYYLIIALICVLVGCSSVDEESNDEIDSTVWPEQFLIGELYSEVLADIQYIEVGNGMTGSGLTIDDSSTIDSIVEKLSIVECRVRPNQEDRSGWMYSYKCYSSNDKDWFRFVIGGSKLDDTTRSGDGTIYMSPYYDIYNTEKLVLFTDELFSLDNED